jgi:hypothetical protein
MEVGAPELKKEGGARLDVGTGPVVVGEVQAERVVAELGEARPFLLAEV